MLIAVGLLSLSVFVMSQNGYVTINWVSCILLTLDLFLRGSCCTSHPGSHSLTLCYNQGKVQKDISGSETYKYIKSGRVMQLLPPSVQVPPFTKQML